jgi:hypothetical protein
MPRKKTIQPQPLESFSLLDGTLVEVRDETCQEIGRGLHKRDAYEKWRDKVAEKVIPIYLDKNGRKLVKPEDDFLSSGYKFSDWLKEYKDEDEGEYLYPESGDDSSVRKRLHKDICNQVSALESALITEKNQKT